MSEDETMPMTESEKMAMAMGSMTEELFNLPPEMRPRVLDALNELVGVSRAEAAAAEEAAEEARANMRLALFTQIASDIIQRYAPRTPPSPAEPAYPPPPPPPASDTNDPLTALMLTLDGAQRASIWAALTDNQRDFVRRLFPLFESSFT